MELEVRHHLPVHQELHRFQVQLVLHLDCLGQKVLQEQLERQVQVAQPVQEAYQALEEQLVSLGSMQVGRLAQIQPMMEVGALECCGCRKPWLQLPEH